MDRLGGILRAVHLLALVVWLGGAVLLFVAVAPSAFGVLPSPALAGRLVGAVIDRLDLIAICATPVLVATALYDERRLPIARWVRVGALVALGVEAVISYFAISPRMVALRETAGFAAEGSPLRAQFSSLHGISMALMTLGVACALVALYFAVRRRPLIDALQAERS